MADRWSVWQSEFEALTPFAEEWKEGRAEDFVRNLLNSAAKKRQQRDALLAQMAEVKTLHATYKQLLDFFNLEGTCQSWSAENCGTADVDRVLAALADWREQILKHGAMFPPPETETRTLSAMQAYVQEARAAAETIRPCVEVLDAALSAKAEMAAAEPESTGSAAA